MKFFLDENIRKEVADFLVEKGHKVVRPKAGAKNGEIIELIKKEGAVLITHDIHFANILMYNHKALPGVIRFRIHPPTASSLISSLGNLLDKLSEEDFKGKLIILEAEDFRIR